MHQTPANERREREREATVATALLFGPRVCRLSPSLVDKKRSKRWEDELQLSLHKRPCGRYLEIVIREDGENKFPFSPQNPAESEADGCGRELERERETPQARLLSLSRLFK